MSERLRQIVLSRGVQDRAAGCISSKGALQAWSIDLRPLLLRNDVLVALADLFWERFASMGPFQMGALETAAIPLMTALILRAPAARGTVNGFIVRKERKTTGLGRAIEGTLEDKPIVLVDDILNSGTSAEKARAVIGQAGRTIAAMFVVVDYRSRQGMAWRQSHDIPVESLFTLADFGLELSGDKAPFQQSYRELWHAGVPGGFPYHVVPKSAPLLVGDTLYRGCDAGRMQAFDAETGAIRWEHHATGAAPRKGIWSSPAASNGRLFYGAYNGTVYCLDAETGREVWVQSCCDWVGASPLVIERHGLVLIGLEYERPWARGAITALDMRSGAKVWEHLVGKFQHGSAAYWRGGDLVVWGTADHQMVALEAATGTLVWAFETRRSVKYAPAIDEARELVAFASFDKSIYLLDVRTGAKRGEWLTDEICYTTPLFADDKLFCGSGDKHLYVIDLQSLQLIEKIDLGARVYASPILIGDRVVVGTNGGRVYEIDAGTLEIRGLLQMPDAVTNAVAATADGARIFVSTSMNDFYAFERLD